MVNRVREVRLRRKWTIQQLHEATGLAHGFISEVETGKKVPSVINAQRLARALGTTVEELFHERASGTANSQ